MAKSSNVPYPTKTSTNSFNIPKPSMTNGKSSSTLVDAIKTAAQAIKSAKPAPGPVTNYPQVFQSEVNSAFNDVENQYAPPADVDPTLSPGVGSSSSSSSGSRRRSGGGGGGGANPAAIQAYLASLESGKTNAGAPYDDLQKLLDAAHVDSRNTISAAANAMSDSVGHARGNIQADAGRRDSLLQSSQDAWNNAGQADIRHALADLNAQGASTADLQGRYAAMQGANQQNAAAQSALTARLDSNQLDALAQRDVGATQQTLGATQGLEQNFSQLLAQLLGKKTDAQKTWDDQIAQYKLKAGL